jgi:hypothetical protein
VLFWCLANLPEALITSVGHFADEDVMSTYSCFFGAEMALINLSLDILHVPSLGGAGLKNDFTRMPSIIIWITLGTNNQSHRACAALTRHKHVDGGKRSPV